MPRASPVTGLTSQRHLFRGRLPVSFTTCLHYSNEAMGQKKKLKIPETSKTPLGALAVCSSPETSLDPRGWGGSMEGILAGGGMQTKSGPHLG